MSSLKRNKSTFSSNLNAQGVERERRRHEILENNKHDMSQNEQNHIDFMKKLNAKYDTLSEKLFKLRSENSKDEQKLRTEFERAETVLESNIEQYDQEMHDKHDALSKIREDYSKVQEELDIVENLYRGKMEEKKRKLDEEERMKKKQQERDEAMKVLNKAAEWVQAHYRGLVTRRALRKGKKGKKKR